MSRLPKNNQMHRSRLCMFIALFVLVVQPIQATECVVLLHGLARTSSSMDKMADAFEEAGYVVSNLDYPSRKYPIERLAPLAVEAGMSQCPSGSVIHFVTHSLGGILLRYYLEQDAIPNLGRVVMLAPPNQGSRVVDKLRYFPGFKTINGPAGMQLGTRENGILSQLGSVDYKVGIIAGSKTFNPILSLYLNNPDDGKVSVENTKVEGMTDFIVVPRSHPFIMKSTDVIAQVISFIKTGQFIHDAP